MRSLSLLTSRAGHGVVVLIVAALIAAAPATRAGEVSRAQLLDQFHLPPLVELPTPPADAVELPDGIDANARVELRCSQSLPPGISVRRVSHNDGRLYLELYAPGPLAGTVDVNVGGRLLANRTVNGSIWLAVKPRIGKLSIQLSGPGAAEPVRLTVPTTLVEIRGRQIFLNGEPFLIKGATGQPADAQQAQFVHELGLNTLRGLGAIEDCQRYGFMHLASLNSGDAAPKSAMGKDDAAFEQTIAKSIAWLKENAPAAIASPNTLILQLGNERTGGMDAPGTRPLTTARRHTGQLLAAARNCVKELGPMLPVGYANQDLGFLAPDCMDVYMHNSFLSKDRYRYPWDDFMRWQGCLPPDGPARTGRPFVNSEFGANHYLCQAYHAGPNNPFLEKLHAWNISCRWAEFMEHGTVGGCIYRLDDLDQPRDQGCSCFGILTHDGKPKLACWDVRRMWRDFEVEPRGGKLLISFKRDYWARDCRLGITPSTGKAAEVRLDDFPPRSSRTIDLGSILPSNPAGGFRWTIAFSTHSGLPARATGAWPEATEQSDFLESLKTRDTYPFLKELFDAAVVQANGQPAPRTLAEMTNPGGLIPVVLRKPNGVAYLLLISRQKPDKDGPLLTGAALDVAFDGNVEKVDDMTGEPLHESIDVVPLGTGGQQLRNIEAARIPGPIGQRSNVPFKLPIYRITPRKS